MDMKVFFEEKGISYIQYQLTTIFGDLKSVSFPVSIWDDMCDGAGIERIIFGLFKSTTK